MTTTDPRSPGQAPVAATVRSDFHHARTAALTDPTAPWRTRAACNGKADLMDQAEPTQAGTRRAKAVCRTCPVLADCKDWVLRLHSGLDPGGVCGGLTELQRLKVRRERDGGPAKTCCRCGKSRPVTEYYADPRALDGLRSECRTCAAERLKLREAAKSQAELSGPKVCTRCKQAQDRKEFNRDRSASSGLHPWCRTCHTAHCTAYRNRKKGLT